MNSALLFGALPDDKEKVEAQGSQEIRKAVVRGTKPAGLVVERLASGSANTWLLRVGEGGLDVLRVRGDRLEVAPFADLWMEP